MNAPRERSVKGDRTFVSLDDGHVPGLDPTHQSRCCGTVNAARSSEQLASLLENLLITVDPRLTQPDRRISHTDVGIRDVAIDLRLKGGLPAAEPPDDRRLQAGIAISKDLASQLAPSGCQRSQDRSQRVHHAHSSLQPPRKAPANTRPYKAYTRRSAWAALLIHLSCRQEPTRAGR